MIGCLSAMTAGGKASGVYPSDTAEQFQYKAHHSRSSVVLVESLEHLKLVSKVVNDLPYLKAIAVWGANPTEHTVGHVKIFGWNDFLSKSDKISEAELDARIKEIRPGHACSLIYTSGTSKFEKTFAASPVSISIH
jgi:long-subunit acyl-CoA synthetase (AMP-forming)